mgnify:FL=1|tara:strand:- start:12112 stop:13263 length:1152 start_codon:yes stop_codon:yes gene_type:complete
MKWTEDEIAYLVLRKGKGNSWNQIQKDLNNKFARDRTINAIMGKWNYLNAKLLKAPFFSESERNFIFNCSRNNFSDYKTIKAFFEQFGRKIDKYDILCVVKDKTIEYEEARIRSETKLDTGLVNLKARIKKNLDKKIKENKVKNMKGRNTTNWTKEEDISVCRYSSAKEAGEELSKTNTKRTKRAITQRWYKLRKSGAMLALKQVKDVTSYLKEKKEKKSRKPRSSGYSSSRWSKEEDLLLSQVSSLNELEAMAKKTGRSLSSAKNRFYGKGFSLKTKDNSRRRWTKEEDFELVCNFYELSIDEARNRFNRSYGAIATRLEMLVDSTKPAHISMLMEASVLIKARKGVRDNKPTKRPKPSRKERKKAKKLAKLEKQMSKLRGE